MAASAPADLAATAATSLESAWSSRASGTIGGRAPRRPARSGHGRPASGQAHPAREMRYTRRDDGLSGDCTR
ncbi:MAG: hypothetical protein ACYCO9_12210 [Streptosporangiaceae bacterium]